ncbi:MAG: hypothetical protein R2713_16945 [Ilumatobacteraceae bacterium]
MAARRSWPCSPCSDSDDGRTAGTAAAGSGGTRPLPTDGGGFVPIQRYPSGRSLVPGEVRLAISLADANGSLLAEGPAVLNGVMRNDQGCGWRPSPPSDGTGLDVPYWSITSTIAKSGLYDMVLEGRAVTPSRSSSTNPPMW